MEQYTNLWIANFKILWPMLTMSEFFSFRYFYNYDYDYDYNSHDYNRDQDRDQDRNRDHEMTMTRSSNTISSSSFDTEDVDDNKNGGKGNINHMSIWRRYIIGYINNKHRSSVPHFFFIIININL